MHDGVSSSGPSGSSEARSKVMKNLHAGASAPSVIVRPVSHADAAWHAGTTTVTESDAPDDPDDPTPPTRTITPIGPIAPDDADAHRAVRTTECMVMTPHRLWPILPAAWWLAVGAVTAVASCQPCLAGDLAHVGPGGTATEFPYAVVPAPEDATGGTVAKSAGRSASFSSREVTP